MSELSPTFQPIGAAFAAWAARIMDVILHIGAHRTGTTTFQDYMRRHSRTLEAGGVGFWGPGRTRRGLFTELHPKTSGAAENAVKRVQTQLDRAEACGLKTLVVSDENMIGTVRDNLRSAHLYEKAADRVAVFARAFEGRISSVVISCRSLDLYWTSAMAYGVARGHPVPDATVTRRIAAQPRGWRDVVTDVAQALPGVPLRVMPFETFCGRPAAFLAAAADLDAPKDATRTWLNRSPNLPALRRVLTLRGEGGHALPFGMGRWNPFTNEDHAALREVYADDLMWLTAGADGLATLTEDHSRTRAEPMRPPGIQTRGQFHEHTERQVARPGRRGIARKTG
jgi:hypothetical protein